ncbi:MAG: hypothetical protein NUW21_11790 [Elusimicrobia bacterium]|nr:hypothetical protein [Elusimicrobiota bacterium]
MRTPLLAAVLLLANVPAQAQDGAFEAEVREASGRLKKSAADAKAVSRAAAPASADCPPETAAEPKLYSSDVRWGLSMAEMLDLYAKLYASDKRLKGRAYYNPAEGRFELPNPPDFGGPVAVPEILIKALVRHIEAAFEDDYIDAVVFPDMGHSHLLIPEALYKAKYESYPVAEKSRFYTDVLSDPAVHLFYHTAEQLQSLKEDRRTVLDDERVRWRHKTRNIAGPISESARLTVYQNPESRANTVGEVPGYFWYGAGFNFSANKSGCFSFKRGGEAVRFDISLSDLEPDPANPVYD